MINLDVKRTILKWIDRLFKLDGCGFVHHSTILTDKNPTSYNSVSRFYYFLF
jgi:hypothetical protein